MGPEIWRSSRIMEIFLSPSGAIILGIKISEWGYYFGNGGILNIKFTNKRLVKQRCKIASSSRFLFFNLGPVIGVISRNKDIFIELMNERFRDFIKFMSNFKIHGNHD